MYTTKSKQNKRTGEIKQALIYCRVSSERQKNEGHGLESQEHRCREYAHQKGYEVEQVFKDSFSGGGDFMNRPAMASLLDYLDKNPSENYAVIFDDLKRFARDTIFHLKLRKEFDARQAKVECLNFTFEDTDEGQFIETILAAQAELERKQNKRQVIQKQKARLEKGYWPFFPPPGYSHHKTSVHGKLLVPNAKALLIKECFEGFALGRFREQSDVQRFLQSRNFLEDKPIYLEYVKRMLRRIVYAGYIEYPEWNVERIKGHHEAIISLETYEKVQDRLGDRKHVKNVQHPDFPMRGLVFCSECEKAMTAAWSKGRSQKYPYYKCQTITCKNKGKGVRKEEVEDGIEEILLEVQPRSGVIALTEEILMDVWNKRINNQEQILGEYRRQQGVLRRDLDSLVEKLTKAQNERVISILEDKIEAIDKQIKDLDKKLSTNQIDDGSYRTAVEIVLGLLKEPVITWQNGGYNGKRLVARLVFSGNLVFDRNIGYRTAELASAIKLFELIQARRTQDVEMAGIAPASE